MKMYCILLSAIVLMHLVDVVISVGSSTRYYANGTSVTCQGVICPLDKIFVPCTHSMGDGRHDTCELCPSDKPRTLDTFDSSAFEDPPDVCKSVLERCTCAEEAELVNPVECAKTLLPNCSCNITAGYYGPDPKACQLSENKLCKLPGYELKQDGSCHECSGDTYKNTHQFGRCLPQPRCYPSLVVDDPGDKAHRRTCKTPVTLPPPDRSTSTESTSTAIGINNPTLSNPTSNVAASTNQTNPLLDSTNSEWIYIVLGAVILVLLLIVCVSTCVNRRKKRQNRNRHQRYQTNDDNYDSFKNGMENSHQQNNSGDRHKSSRVFKTFKKKFCTKTWGSSKGYELVKLVKTTTKNEEKNTVDGDQTSYIVYVDEIKEKVNSNGITEIADNMDIEMNGDETVEEVNGDDTSENVNDDETVENVNRDETAEKVIGDETAENVNDDETAEKMNGGETAEKVNGGETAEKVNGGETAEKVNDETVEKVNGDETTEKVNGGETAEKVNGDETAEKVNGDETAEKVNGGETAEKVNGDETTEKVNGGETTEKVNGSETAEKVNDDETAEKVTKIDSCENTTTNPRPCATENHDASYASLDVNSLYSSEKMSSGLVDDMYILTWSPRDGSSSKGFIECTDSSGNQLKSMTINNGSQGMILLKMKDLGEGCTFIFVSSSENCGIQSFVPVIVEPVTRNLDLKSLKSGLSTLDFSSFKVVQNRPEEDLSFQRSLDQPHHMPLLLSQRQADSGISDTTPAECGSQAGNSVPRLSFSSFNQDQDGN